jgi:protein-tyrosine-phosphatase
VLPHPQEGNPFRVLFVCTGNICRSPVAERLARGYLEAALGPESAAFHVASAGTHAVVGSGVHPDSAGVLIALGGDAEGFAARQLTDELAAEADLVLTMTREHRHAVLKRVPRGLARTYTLREAADLASLVPAGLDLPGATVPARCRSLVREMAAARARRTGGGGDDILDPIGQMPGVHMEIGEVIAGSVLGLFGRFAGSDPASEVARLHVPEPVELPLAAGRAVGTPAAVPWADGWSDHGWPGGRREAAGKVWSW